MFSALLALSLLYALVLGLISLGAGRLQQTKHGKPDTIRNFSIIVPFRNEEANLKLLLQDLNALVYPKEGIEFLLVNDSSTDASATLVQQFMEDHPDLTSCKLLQLAETGQTGKKQAITMAIEQAKHPWILTTDADTRIPFAWLHLINLELEQSQAQMICGPIAYVSGKNWLERFQAMDNLALQSISRGLFGWNKPLLANGANFCYSKELFRRLDGFSGNLHHPSGDDQFLLEKARMENPKQIAYLNRPDAAVLTYAEPNLKALLNQRVRWAGKTRFNKSRLLGALALLVGLTNLAIALLPLLLWYFPNYWEQILILPALKWSTDAWLIFNSGAFFGTRPRLTDFIGACLFYPYFGTWVFLKGLGKRYSWKERQLQH